MAAVPGSLEKKALTSLIITFFNSFDAQVTIPTSQVDVARVPH